MSTFDFDTVINRRGTNSYKWDIVKEEDVIPLWVADMDFKAAPAILEALKKRVEHGVFGYTLVPDSYYEAIINWFARRHNWQIDRSWIIYTTGVVPAVSCAIKALTLPGEKVLIQTPDYNCFFSSIKNNGCEVAENELVRRGDSYEVDFEDFERQCADEKTTVFLLCNPHNPAGRVWTKEELKRMNDICLAHGVRVISDEIHCELVMPGHRFTPFAAISDACRDNSVVLNSPTKAFNIAGLQIANIICADPAMRRRIDRAVNINEVCDVNPFGVAALQAAYNESEEWLDSLNHYIWGNYLALKEFIAKELPRLEVTRLEGTYLAWVDIKATGLTSDEAYGKLMKEGRVYVNSGTMYGRRAGEGYLRINLACPRATLLEGLKRMGGVLRQYLS
ncbi:MalY/PatB family protein [Segatella buccae]|uniref:MalY/PatB family protein n=1 Tax=Segatella buccae TaxID=28126 RepID=UPI00065FEDA1|nr:MalY/PatB family protein [Segatella buccae]